MSYSRLPVPTSARSTSGSGIPRSRLEGDLTNNGTSFKYSGIGSNYPGTVRKANLFTPQNKKISFPTGASTQSSNRSSLAPDRKYSKDPRPIAERDYQQSCFEKLIDFLTTHQYPHPLPDSKRFFQTVSKTDTVRMFEFLLNFFFMSDQPFKITNIEIDVPRALKLMNYPFTVTKSNLVSVASRQSIATLLSIFDWLVDSIEYFLKLNEVDSTDDCSSNEQSPIIAKLFKMATIAKDETHLESLMMEYANQVYGSEEEVLRLEKELEIENKKVRELQDTLIQRREKVARSQRYSEQAKQDELEIAKIEKEMQEMMSDYKQEEQELAEAVAENNLIMGELGPLIDEECIVSEKEKLIDVEKKLEVILKENARDEKINQEKEVKINTILNERLKKEKLVSRDLDEQLMDLARESQKNDDMKKDLALRYEEFEETCSKEQEDLTAWIRHKLETVSTQVDKFSGLMSDIQDMTDDLEKAAIESREAKNLY